MAKASTSNLIVPTISSDFINIHCVSPKRTTRSKTMIALVLLVTASTMLLDSRVSSAPTPANPAAVKPSSYSYFPHPAHSLKQKSDRLSEALQVIIKEGAGKSLEELHAKKTEMGLKRGQKISSSTTESTIKLEWTPSQSHDDLSSADAGDVI